MSTTTEINRLLAEFLRLNGKGSMTAANLVIADVVRLLAAHLPVAQPTAQAKGELLISPSARREALPDPAETPATAAAPASALAAYEVICDTPPTAAFALSANEASGDAAQEAPETAAEAAEAFAAPTPAEEAVEAAEEAPVAAADEAADAPKHKGKKPGKG